MTHRISVAMLLLCGIGVGCAAQDRPAMVISSDPALAELASTLLPDLARRSGMELREPVRIEERTREELVRYLRFKLDEELPEEEARARVDAYALLGLVPPDLDLRDVLMRLYTEQVAGFYDPDSTALFVMDDQPPADLRSVLLHELVHAVQDQTADLDALTDPALGSDRVAAAQAAIEGHATLVMFEYMAEQQTGSPVDLGQIPGFGALLRRDLEAARSQFPALASAPRVVQESLLFPYIEGAVYLQGLWASGERVAPFGEHLPRSTEEILSGRRAQAPIELRLDVTGGEVVLEDVLGRLELGVLVDELLGREGAGLADGWDGDRYVLVERPNGDRVLVSYVLWEDEAARDRFVVAIQSVLDRFGGPAVVEGVDVAGRPATLITVGPAEGIVVRAAVASG